MARVRNSTLCSTRGTGDRLRLVARDTRANVLHPPCTLPSKVGCPHVQKRGPSPPAERPETVLDVQSGPERRKHSCAGWIGKRYLRATPRELEPHIPTQTPQTHTAPAALPAALSVRPIAQSSYSDRLKYPQVPSSRPIPVALSLIHI